MRYSRRRTLAVNQERRAAEENLYFSHLYVCQGCKHVCITGKLAMRVILGLGLGFRGVKEGKEGLREGRGRGGLWEIKDSWVLGSLGRLVYSGLSYLITRL